jgi:cyclic pyranopterin phosphate synthase
VALAGQNEDEIVGLLEWCAAQGFDLTLIETMPLGDVEGDRTDRFLPLDVVKRQLEKTFTLVPSLHRTGGPARYYQVEGTGTRLGLISPLTRNFCSGCNRIRVTATGTVYGCLGRDQHVELRDALRTGGRARLDMLLDEVIAGKPLGHDFNLSRSAPAVARHMSVTGG